MQALVTVQLVSHSTEQTVAVAFHFLDLETQWCQKLGELFHVDAILILIDLLRLVLSLPFSALIMLPLIFILF